LEFIINGIDRKKNHYTHALGNIFAPILCH